MPRIGARRPSKCVDQQLLGTSRLRLRKPDRGLSGERPIGFQLFGQGLRLGRNIVLGLPNADQPINPDRGIVWNTGFIKGHLCRKRAQGVSSMVLMEAKEEARSHKCIANPNKSAIWGFG